MITSLALAAGIFAGNAETSEGEESNAFRIAKDPKAAPDARLAATKELTDQTELAYIAKNDEDGRIRLAAALKLDDQHQTIAQKVFADIAQYAQNPTMRYEAVNKLTDTTVLADIVKNEENDGIRVGIMLTDRLTDQAVFADIAKNDKYNDMRLRAVKKLTDQAVLTDVAKKEKNVNVRGTAVAKLTDPILLADIARNDENKDVRQTAVHNDNLTDQTVLTDIVKNEKEQMVRYYATLKLTDQALLADIAKNDQDTVIRIEAACKLDNRHQMEAQAVFVDVVKNAKDTVGFAVYSRAAAAGQLIDPVLLADVAKNDKAKPVRWAAVKNKKLTDLTLLVDLAKNDKDADIRIAAAAKLEGEEQHQALAQAVFADLAKNAELWGERLDAVRKLTDQTLLADIAKNDQHDSVRRDAQQRLYKLQRGHSD